MQLFNAILYGKDLPLTGADTEAGFDAASGNLICGARRIASGDITLRVGGFGHDELHLDWTDADGEAFTLKPRGKADIAFVIAHAPPLLQQQMAHWHQRRLSIRLVWSSLAALACVITAAAGLLWWRYDEALTWAASHVSVENEQRLGRHVLETLEADTEIIRSGAAVEAMKSIGSRLTEHSRYDYQWYVQKDDTVNAFALPGGIIVVNSALLRSAESPEELAGVLAHEVQHVEGRHSLKSMLNSLGFATVLLVVLGDVSASTAVIVHQIGNMYFSRDIEEEADEKGFHALVNAGIPPAGMISFFQKLQGENGETRSGGAAGSGGPDSGETDSRESGSGALAWLSTHPETGKRIEKLQRLYESHPCPACTPLDLDWERVLQDDALASKKK